MVSTIAPPRVAAGKQPPALGRIKSSGVSGVRVVLNAVEGFGKTTFGSHAPKPAVLMARGETGFATLRQRNRVPDVDAVELSDWPSLLKMIEQLGTTDHESVVIDALGGFERLCHEHVCARDFDGEWGEKGFLGYGRGPDLAVSEWLKLLYQLDRLRAIRPVNVVILSHAKVKGFKNPLGPDFDRYVADCHEKTWGVTHKWADVVLFGQFLTLTVEDRKTKRARGVGGVDRLIYTQRTDGYDAKNRYGMPEQLSLGGPDEVWKNVWDAMNGVDATAEPIVDQAPEL